MTIAGIAVGATQGYIYLRVEYPHAHRALDDAIAAAYQRGYLGADILGSGRRFDLEVRLGAGAYICGEETSMLESLEGKRGEVRVASAAAGGQGPVRPADRRQQRHLAGERADHPATKGARSTATSASADRAARFRFSSAATSSAAVWSRRRSALTLARIAVRLRRRLARPGGRFAPCRWAVRLARIMPESPIRHAARLRGVCGDRAPCSAMAASSCSTTPSTWRSMARYAMEFCAIESCGKCTPCRIGSTRGVEVIDRVMHGHRSRRGISQLLEELCETMVHGSLCGLGGMTPFPVQSAFKHFREDFER